jgi:hypothetical protein
MRQKNDYLTQNSVLKYLFSIHAIAARRSSGFKLSYYSYNEWGRLKEFDRR